MDVDAFTLLFPPGPGRHVINDYKFSRPATSSRPGSCLMHPVAERQVKKKKEEKGEERKKTHTPPRTATRKHFLFMVLSLVTEISMPRNEKYD